MSKKILGTLFSNIEMYFLVLSLTSAPETGSLMLFVFILSIKDAAYFCFSIKIKIYFFFKYCEVINRDLDI